jgi:hypothetical protein
VDEEPFDIGMDHVAMEGAVAQELEYHPLPMVRLGTAIVSVEGQVFVNVLYKDVGGEKALWFVPVVAKKVGDEMTRLAGEAMKIERQEQVQKSSGLVLPTGADLLKLQEDLKKGRSGR